MSSYQVPEGYKQTEVGVIPEDWAVVSIGKLEPQVTSGSRGWAQYYSKFGAPFIRITNLTRQSIYLDLEELRRVKLPDGVNEGKRTELRNGDILISITADIGIVGYVDDSLSKPAYINQHVSLVRFDPRETDSKFIAYFLASENVQRLFRGATDQGAKAGLNLDTIRSLKFAFPNLIEQQAIATTLSDIDALIAKLDKLIAKKRHLKTAAMQQLLTGKKRLPGFGGGINNEQLIINNSQVPEGYKQTEVGVIPEDWELCSLQSLTTTSEPITYGVLKPGDYVYDGIPLLQIKDVIHGDIKVEELHRIGEKLDRQYSRTKLSGGEIVVSLVGTIGKIAYIPASLLGANLHRNLAKIAISQDNDSKFVFYQLVSERIQSAIKLTTFGSTQALFNLGDLRSLLMIVSPLIEQQEIATVLSDIDTEITALETRRTKIQAIKQGMMQELLTGKTRLINSE